MVKKALRTANLSVFFFGLYSGSAYIFGIGPKISTRLLSRVERRKRILSISIFFVLRRPYHSPGPAN